MKVLYSIIFLFVLVGCSSVVSGGRQAITVVTPDVEGAYCSLSDRKGRVWYIEETPGIALVKKGDGPLSVICSKEGYMKGTGMVQESLANSNYGNLALGPAAPIGYFVDGLTGSAQEYNDKIEIFMEEYEAKRKWNTSYDDDEDY